MILIVVISLMGMNPQSAGAAGTYYVDNTVACSDSGPGSLANPFCTLTKAASVAVAPGDTVYVKHGTYAETVYPAAGTVGNPITFKADPGVTVTGDPTGFGSAFAISTKSYIVIDGFTITTTVNKGIFIDSSDHITLTNNNVSYAGLNQGPASHSQGIYLKNTTYSIVTGNVTHHNSCIGIRLINSSDYNTISNNISYANSSAIADPVVAVSDAAGIELTGSSNNTVINNITYGNEDSGINVYVNGAGVPSSYNVIVGNLSYGNGDHGIDHNNSPYNTVIGNTVHGNGTTGINFEGSSGSHHATIANNISAGNGFNPPDGSFGGNLRVDAASVAGTVLDYDIFYRQSASVQIIWNDSNYTTLSAFRAVEPTQELHGLEGDPQFVTPVASVLRVSGTVYPGSEAIGDYHLKAASPAIDSANSAALNQPTADIEGKMRADIPTVANTGAGARLYDDRGAYEYQAVGITPTSTTVNCGAGNPVVAYGASISCVATVVAGSGTTTPTGNVNWATNGNGTFATSPCTLSGANGTATCSLSYTPSSIGSGLHLIAANYAGDANFLSSSGNRTVTVNPKALTISGVVANNKIYNGNMGAALNTTAAALVGVVTGDSATLAGTPVGTFADKNVGNGKPVTVTGFTLSGPSAGNYLLTQPTGLVANITPKALTVSAAGVNKVYDGMPSATVTLASDAIVGDAVALAYTSASFADSNAGTSKPVSVSGISISGADAGNYNLLNTTANTTANITPRDLAVSAAAASKVYDGTTAATVTLSGNGLAGDTLAIAYTSAAFADANAGAGKPVSVSGISLGGEDAGNYHLVNATVGTTANITKAPLTVTPHNQSKSADQPDPAFTFVYSGYVNGETSAVIDTPPTCGVSVPHAVMGTYPIVCSGGADNNYSFNFLVGTLTVRRAFEQIFVDVPVDFWSAHFIHAIYEQGITTGCSTSPLKYCPDTPVTRAQMAIFLLKAKHGSQYMPPPAVGVFGDVPANFWAGAWIEQLAKEGITSGCGAGNYCPETPVTRDQMAVFLLKAKHGISYLPPAPTGVFGDVSTTHWAGAWIEQLVAEGITVGCGNGNYCPLVPVSRDQMAVFLTRTFSLPIP
jgi:parallel beta-helix repeat protein